MNKLEKRLRELRVWTRFQKNVRSLNNKGFIFFDGECEHVSAAFIWEISPEGYDFWYNIDNKIRYEG